MKKKILITGGSGFLAVNWALSIRNHYEVTLLLHHRKISLMGVNTAKAFVSSLSHCLRLLEKHQPDIVIHTASLTSVEKCESNVKLAKEINTDLARNIAIACEHQGVKLVHISTDHLFSGECERVDENANPNPLNHYGKTKLQGEQQVIKNCKSALIVRTNFFGWGTNYRPSFSDFILNNLKKGKTVDLFQDVFFTPILIDELIDKVHRLIDADMSGIFNVVGDDRLSKYDFGIKLANHFDLDANLIHAISIDDRQNLVHRPKDMSLSNVKLYQTLDCKIPPLSGQFQMLRAYENKNVLTEVSVDMIPYGNHYIDEHDVNSVIDVLQGGMLTQGPKIYEFENKIAGFVGAQYGVAVSSGTAALHLACMALDPGKGDGVITSPNTFVASSNAILYVGAQPVFVDIDSDTLNIDIDRLESAIQSSSNIKAIMPVHFAGLPCEMEKIRDLADKYELAVIEDASHALGATYSNGAKVGNCQYSDMTVLSFHPVKGIAAGEGGMILTNDSKLYQKLTLLRSHGITKGNFEFPGISEADDALINKQEALENGELKRWYYEMQYLGYNYRMTDIQCALAVSQMDKIELFLARRREIVQYYDQAFKDCPNIKPLQLQGRDQSSHHIYVVAIDFNKIGISRHQFMQELANQGVGSQVHYIPVVKQPFYQSMGYDICHYPKTDLYYQDTLSIPLYYSLSDSEQTLVISVIKSLLL